MYSRFSLHIICRILIQISPYKYLVITCHTNILLDENIFVWVRLIFGLCIEEYNFFFNFFNYGNMKSNIFKNADEVFSLKLISKNSIESIFSPSTLKRACFFFLFHFYTFLRSIFFSTERLLSYYF